MNFFSFVITASLLLGFAVPVSAKDGVCTISIEALAETLAGKQPWNKVRVALKDGERHHFIIQNSNTRCTLAYFGGEVGTSVSCDFDGSDQFVQSDRTTIKEKPINNISFRRGGGMIDIKTSCESR